MEIRLSVGLLAVLAFAAHALTASEPVAVLDPSDPDVHALAQLEDATAQARTDLERTRQLANEYLHRGRPGLAIATVRAAPPDLVRDPLLTHRLAQAYEATGRVDDALATAQLAHARCLCSARGVQTCASVPRCSIGMLTALEMHEDALEMLARWGVQDPRHDGRTGLAYRLAQRTARIASIGVTTPVE